MSPVGVRRSATWSEVAQVIVDLRPLDVPLEEQLPARVVLSEERHLGLEDEVVAAGRID